MTKPCSSFSANCLNADMVRSMMIQTTLSKSFWDYALGTAARILNMVQTKKVEKTPYEVWQEKAPKLSYLKVWGCEALVNRDTLTKPDKLGPISIKCIFIGYPKERMGYSFYYSPENKKLEESLVTHFQDFQNTFESSNDNTNVVNAPREPFVVKQDHVSFVDKIIFDLNRAPDSPHLHIISPNQFRCFHCKDVLGDGVACQRCTCTKCGSGLSKGLCYICGNNQNSLNDSPCLSENSSQSPPHINHCCYECGDPLDGIFCKRCTCKSCGKDSYIGYNCPPKVPVISNSEPCKNQTIDELPQTLPSFHPTFHSEDESPFTCDSTPNYIDESPNVFNPPPQPLVYSYQTEDFSESNKEFSLTDEDSFSIDNIDYVEASPPDSELVSSEVIEIVIPEVRGIDDDILLMIKDDILREKLLNVNLLIAKIEALNDNPTPSSDCKTKSSSTSLNYVSPGSESRPPMLNKENYVPWSSRLLQYAKSRPNGKLIHNSILNGPYVRKMILEAGDANREITEIWLRVQQMMKGSDIGIQEKKAKLFNKWERFTSNEGESIESYYHQWSRHVTIVHQTKDLHTADYTQLYDFLMYNQKEVDELKAERLAKTQDPLALMENSNNPYAFPAPHQDQSSFNQNYLQQPMPNPEDITDPTTAMNMALTLMAKAFKLNYSTPTNNNQRISSNPRNRQIAQPGMNMGQNRQTQMVGGNGGNQFRQYAGKNAGNSAGYNDVIGNHVIQNAVQNLRVQNVGNPNGLIGIQGNGNQNQIGNGNPMAARAEGNAAAQNGNQIRCYNCRGVGHYARNFIVRPRRRDVAYLQTQLLIAQKEEAGIQLQAEEYDLMAAAADLDEIEEVNANCILMANLQQASTSGTQTDSAPVYDT
nr:retrovirus-related Pol polyprotein from transposon TNT 1-94 [Tanacetum cinerariifolium]